MNSETDVNEHSCASPCSPAVPDAVGEWELTRHDGEVISFETYELPTGQLVAWCEECGLSGGIDHSLFWNDDEWVGHVPVCLMSDWGDFRRVQ
jgi:hypothetical protein